MTKHTIVQCTFERHADAMLDIYNDTILNSTSLYEYELRTTQTMVKWFAAKQEGNFPVLGVENSEGALMGFASYGPFRPYPAKKYSVEHSVYVHKDYRGHGLGKVLLQNLIEAARARNMHAMIGAIDTSNAASIRLHEFLGFTHVGTLLEIGFKFGRWLDMSFYQLLLDTPSHPEEG